MQGIETREIKGTSITIYYDEDPPNPRIDYDPLGTMVCFHLRYELGDKDHGYRTKDYANFDEMKNAFNAAVCLPVYLFDHSGLMLSAAPFACGWDSGQVGFIFLTSQQLIECWGEDTPESRKKGLEGLVAAVDEYGAYIGGQVYGYQTVAHGEVIDSCWGFFGDLESVFASAESEIPFTNNGVLPYGQWEERN